MSNIDQANSGASGGRPTGAVATRSCPFNPSASCMPTRSLQNVKNHLQKQRTKELRDGVAPPQPGQSYDGLTAAPTRSASVPGSARR